ncbi:uncharacterized protein BKA78DRAFT_400 [Phyllosticta capitalensis]|uniref:uncharacterized protein n=1 Tax=Phyllosticta capitalensis TaxID=121624 RepID=UPI0031320EFB
MRNSFSKTRDGTRQAPAGPLTKLGLILGTSRVESGGVRTYKRWTKRPRPGRPNHLSNLHGRHCRPQNPSLRCGDGQREQFVGVGEGQAFSLCVVPDSTANPMGASKRICHRPSTTALGSTQPYPPGGALLTRRTSSLLLARYSHTLAPSSAPSAKHCDSCTSKTTPHLNLSAIALSPSSLASPPPAPVLAAPSPHDSADMLPRLQ